MEDVQENLFSFNPKMSYVADAWMKADQDSEAEVAAPATKPDAKPAQ